MKAFSTEVWEHSRKIITDIEQHPFNQELMQGTLPIDTFAYYIEQDSHYLKDYSRVLASIGVRSTLSQEMRFWYQRADHTFIAEQEMVHQVLSSKLNLQTTQKLTPALIGYTSYLLRTSSIDSVEVTVAAVLPCFWIYQHIGKHIAEKAVTENNPYKHWIDTYASEEFESTVRQAIGIFDRLALNASPEIKDKMVEAFYNASCYEWHFWNDAYHKVSFDETSNVQALASTHQPCTE